MSRPPRLLRFFPLLLPLLPLLIFGVGRLAGWEETERGGYPAGAASYPPLNGAEFNRERSEIDRLNDREAYDKARQVVRAELLPPRATVQFPDVNPVASGAEVTPISVVRRKPHIYCVRGVVYWREAGGAMRRRRFEADVRHGPVGDKWSLVDTEFLRDGDAGDAETEKADSPMAPPR